MGDGGRGTYHGGGREVGVEVRFARLFRIGSGRAEEAMVMVG